MIEPSTKVAVVGIAGRFPGANTTESLWEDIVKTGTEAVVRYDVPGGTVGFGVLEDAAMFDSGFFDMSPAEARSITPEHRLFLEYCWAALEDASIDITSFDGFASVYASASNHSISYLRRILTAVEGEQVVGAFGLLTGNAMDSMATRVGYKLGLRGECISVQTHCSSSLVAIHLACQSLLSGHSDIALAGGASVRGSVEADQEAEFARGVAQEGFILSAEGRCLALLEGATGTISGDGVGVVVLKMLDRALEDEDFIYAVIPGTGINNDGRRKVGFTAPSVDGVTDAIEDALAFAQIEPDAVDYIECHGTGTDLGDAIELRALRQVFERDGRSSTNPLHLGSIKSSIGHLAGAAGVTSFIKAVLSVHRGGIPPLTHSMDHAPHSEIQQSPILKLAKTYADWTPSGKPRRAGVSSLGIGGTNVHILVEQAPAQEQTPPSTEPPASLLVWSATSPRSLSEMSVQLAEFADRRGHDVLASEMAHTLQTGRAQFEEREYLVASSTSDIVDGVHGGRVERLTDNLKNSPRKVAFMFPGYGVERPGMGRELMEGDPTIREHLQTCQQTIERWTDFDLIAYLEDDGFDDSEIDTSHTGLAIVSLEWAVAQMYMGWGVTPDVIMGSSLGEYAAACVAGALSLEDTLRLVFVRGRLLENARGGGMLLVESTYESLKQSGLLADGLEDAIHVSNEHTIVSGPSEAVEQLAAQLAAKDIYHRSMPVEIAFHSGAVEPLREEFIDSISTVRFSETKIPLISNLTGTWFDTEVNAPQYWYDQMRSTVKFREGIQILHKEGVRCYLEIGAGRGLAKFCEWNYGGGAELAIARSSTTHSKSTAHDWSAICDVVGMAWLFGKPVDWERFSSGSNLRRVPLPTYRFQRRFYYLGEETPELDESEKFSHGGSRRSPTRTFPRNYLEEQVASIWQDILGVSEIGIDENFFDLGGDSLQATRVLGRLQADVTSDISVQDIMQFRTIREIASLLESKLQDEEGPSESEESEADYYCAFELDFGGVPTTVHLTKDEYEKNGIPEGATNIRIQTD